MSMNLSVVETSSSSNVDNGYDVYLVDCSAGNLTLDLQDDWVGKAYFIKRVDSNVGYALTVNGNTYQIEGQASKTVGPLQTLNLIRTSNQWVRFC